MTDYFEVDFLGVETDKSGDAIAIRYSIAGVQYVHVVDGGYIDTGDQVILHIEKYYGTTGRINNVVLTHPDGDHANGLRKVLEHFDIDALWMHRPWIYAGILIDRFKTYESVPKLEQKLRDVYASVAELEAIAIKKGIPIFEPFQGQKIGAFTVLAPTKARYLDLVVESNKTPEHIEKGFLVAAMESAKKAVAALGNLIAGEWGLEYFPPDGTSNENEMSVVQWASLNGKQVLLTGDAGREALAEAIAYAPLVGAKFPVNYIQVPHHGGRRNVSTEILDALLGKRLETPSEKTLFTATCSSAKADEHHPKKVVQRAFMHRGAHWAATEGRNLSWNVGIQRDGWSAVPQAEYPTEFEE